MPHEDCKNRSPEAPPRYIQKCKCGRIAVDGFGRGIELKETGWLCPECASRPDARPSLCVNCNRNQVVSPPPRFKKGDWVTHAIFSAEVGRVASSAITDSNEYSVLTKDGTYHNWHLDNVRKWTPRDGEWVIRRYPNDIMSTPFWWSSRCQLEMSSLIPAPLGDAAEEWFA